MSGILTTSLNARAAPSQQRVVLVVDGINEDRNLPVLLAERLGYFASEGLLVTLMEGREDVSTDDLLADGRADGAVAFYHHTFMSQAAGHSTESVITMGVTPALSLLVASRLKDQVKTIADLRGRKIYAGGRNSGKTTSAVWLMANVGLTPADVPLLKPEGRDAMSEALRLGGADAIVSHQPDTSFYETSGSAFKLADLTTVSGTKAGLGVLFPSTSLYLTNDYVARNPDIVQHLVNALARSLIFINAHSTVDIAAALPTEIMKNGKDYGAVLPFDVKMFATDGRMSESDARRELEIMASYTPVYGKTNFDKTYTNTFIEKALTQISEKR
jgi:NitT/TauT family transport system substrate-binding protein